MGLLGILSFIVIWTYSVLTAELAYFQDTAEDYFGQSNKLAIRLHRTVAGLAALVGMCVALSFAHITPKQASHYGAYRLNGHIAYTAGTMSAFAGTMLFNIGFEVTREYF